MSSDLTTPRGAMDLLAHARTQITRLTPAQALAAQVSGAIIVDLRTEAQRRLSHELPGALVIDLTVLAWRLDPTFEYRIPEATGWDVHYVLVCRHGYSSSVAAAMLRQMGLTDVSDVDGGYAAWEAAGLPVHDGPADIRE